MPMLFERVSARLAQTTTLAAWCLLPDVAVVTASAPVQGNAPQKPAIKVRRRLGAPLTLAASVALLPAMALFFLLLTQTITAWAYPESHWRDRLQTMIRPAVLDSAGTLVGFMPPPGATDLESRYAVDPGEIAPACIDLVLAREDAHYNNPWRHIRGVDLVSAARAIGRVGGASSLAMQLSRQLHPDWTKRNRWQRKLLEAGSAATLLQLHDNNYRALAASYLAVAPFAIAYGDVRGIAAAADVFWQTTPARLTAAQCAALVVLLPKRLKLVSGESDELQAAWKERLGQARKLLLSSRYDDSAHDLESWPQVPLRPPLVGLGEAARLNLGVRTRALVLPQLARIEADQTPELSINDSIVGLAKGPTHFQE